MPSAKVRGPGKADQAVLDEAASIIVKLLGGRDKGGSNANPAMVRFYAKVLSVTPMSVLEAARAMSEASGAATQCTRYTIVDKAQVATAALIEDLASGKVNTASDVCRALVEAARGLGTRAASRARGGGAAADDGPDGAARRAAWAGRQAVARERQKAETAWAVARAMCPLGPTLDVGGTDSAHAPQEFDATDAHVLQWLVDTNHLGPELAAFLERTDHGTDVVVRRMLETKRCVGPGPCPPTPHPTGCLSAPPNDTKANARSRRHTCCACVTMLPTHQGLPRARGDAVHTRGRPEAGASWPNNQRVHRLPRQDGGGRGPPRLPDAAHLAGRRPQGSRGGLRPSPARAHVACA